MVDRASPSVLLVDDYDDVRLLWRILLERHGGFDPIHEAASGEHAVYQLVRYQPQVVLTDLHLGGLSGFDLLDLLRLRSPDTVVVITSAAGDDLDAEARRRGAAAFLPKPQTGTSSMPVLLSHLARTRSRHARPLRPAQRLDA